MDPLIEIINNDLDSINNHSDLSAIPVDRSISDIVKYYTSIIPLYKKEVYILKSDEVTKVFENRYVYFTIEYTVGVIGSRFGIGGTEKIIMLKYTLYFTDEELQKFEIDTSKFSNSLIEYLLGLFIRYMFLPNVYKDVSKFLVDSKQTQYLHVVPRYSKKFNSKMWRLIWPFVGDSNGDTFGIDYKSFVKDFKYKGNIQSNKQLIETLITSIIFWYNDFQTSDPFSYLGFYSIGSNLKVVSSGFYPLFINIMLNSNFLKHEIITIVDFDNYFIDISRFEKYKDVLIELLKYNNHPKYYRLKVIIELHEYLYTKNIFNSKEVDEFDKNLFQNKYSIKGLEELKKMSVGFSGLKKTTTDRIIEIFEMDKP